MLNQNEKKLETDKEQMDYADADELNIIDIIKPMWINRTQIISITIASMFLFTLFAKFFQSYESQGVFQFAGPIPLVIEKEQEKDDTDVLFNEIKTKDKDKNTDKERENDNKNNNIVGISFGDYKKFSATFNTHERFEEYIKDKQLTLSPGVSGLLDHFNSNAAISEMIMPIYPFTKLDAKEFVFPTNVSNLYVIGVRLSYKNSSPEIAHSMAKLLGEYVIDSIVYQIYHDLLYYKSPDVRNELRSIDNKIILNNLYLEKFERKVSDLKKIIKQYQSFEQEKIRQDVVVSSIDDTSYYSPKTQLIASAVKISNIHGNILKLKREKRRLELMLEYYELYAAKVLNKTKSGLTLLQELDKEKEIMFKDKNVEDDLVRQTYNSITIENQMAKNLYFDKSRFISGPNLPIISNFKLLKNLAIGGLVGLAIAIAYIFGKNWWKKNNHILINNT